ncbi:MAG: hypothetical protein QG622_3561 [Actinomycetota bacterium]|nr:hypothetical protein [Actinomycetota bacterium]
MTTAEMLLHPVRLQVVQAFLGGRELTTGQLGELLPGVSTATLYRQVGILAEGGLLRVVRERQARGGVERTYRLVVEASSVGASDARQLSREDHRHGFTVFVAGILAAFDRYLARDGVDLAADLVGYRQTALNLTDEEMGRFLVEYRELVTKWSDVDSPKGRRRLFSTIVMPSE